MEKSRDANHALDQHCVKFKVSCFLNSRGMRLCASSWQLAHSDPKALLLLCHGYSINCSTYFYSTAESLAQQGFAVFGLDAEGFGFSEGEQGYNPSLQLQATDYIDYFRGIRGKHVGKPRFLIGESMGGAVAQIILHREPQEWSGGILMAPLYKMPAPLMPSPLGLAWLSVMRFVRPLEPGGPPVDLATYAYEEPSKREAYMNDALMYKGPFRLATWWALIQGAEDAQKIAPEISVPILIVHGEKDNIVDVDSVKALESALGSSEKTLILYPDMCHLLTEGAFEKNARTVLADMASWLDKHCA